MVSLTEAAAARGKEIMAKAERPYIGGGYYHQDIEEYFTREVLPHVPDAWIDYDKTKVGYEIPFTRHFYRYVPPRPLEEIQKDLRVLVGEIQAMLAEVTVAGQKRTHQ